MPYVDIKLTYGQSKIAQPLAAKTNYFLISLNCKKSVVGK